MKAIVCSGYGPPEVLEFREVPDPRPGAHDVRIRVRATSVHRGDSRMRAFDVPPGVMQRIMARLYLGVFKPRRPILGMEFAGEIESVGRAVTGWSVGDRVLGSTAWHGFGAYAELVCSPADGPLAPIPDGLSFEEAAVVPSGGLTVLGILETVELKPDSSVLIYGASGSVGTFAVQLARARGAEVTGVCSTSNLELVRSLGAREVIDYTQRDVNQLESRYDVVFDAVGRLPGDGRALVAPGGTFLDIHVSSNMVKKSDGARLLRRLAAMLEAGELRPVIDRTYDWTDIVEAHRYVDLGHKVGNVAVSVVP